MDRNALGESHIPGLDKVALLAEGVGRNLDVHPDAAIGAVAFLAESVDRNSMDNVTLTLWAIVALLAEDVDRNYYWGIVNPICETSPSSRRARIEISAISMALITCPVV